VLEKSSLSAPASIDFKGKALGQPPEVLLQGKYTASQPIPCSYTGVTYGEVDAFAFINTKGEKQSCTKGSLALYKMRKTTG
jgi:hypothetical protein